MTRRRHGAGDRPEKGTRTRASGAGPRQPGRGEPSHAAGDDASREALVWADSAVQRPVRLLVLFDCPIGTISSCGVTAPGAARCARFPLWTVVPPSALNGSWNEAPNNPSVAGAVSATACAIGAASAFSAWDPTSCKRQVTSSTAIQVGHDHALIALLTVAGRDKRAHCNWLEQLQLADSVSAALIGVDSRVERRSANYAEPRSQSGDADGGSVRGGAAVHVSRPRL
jgi:hypothetical protein